MLKSVGKKQWVWIFHKVVWYGSSILVYTVIGATAVALSGVLTAVMNAICLQYLHIITVICNQKFWGYWKR